jgi:hypothetical protein
MVKSSILDPAFVGFIYLFIYLGSCILKARKISKNTKSLKVYGFQGVGGRLIKPRTTQT